MHVTGPNQSFLLKLSLMVPLRQEQPVFSSPPNEVRLYYEFLGAILPFHTTFFAPGNNEEKIILDRLYVLRFKQKVRPFHTIIFFIHQLHENH